MNLEQHLNRLIQTETRSVDKCNRFTVRNNGVKRTHIVSASVIPIVTETQTDPVLNSGTTIQGVLTPGPMSPSDVHQGQLSDCWVLGPMISILTVRPNFFADIVYPIGSNTCVCQYIFQNKIVRITCSTLIATNYNVVNGEDVRIELIEKTIGLLRTGVSDYNGANIGSGLEFFSYCGLTTGIINKTGLAISNALANNLVLDFITTTAPTGWVSSHCYAVLAPTIVQQPWYGGTNIAITDSILSQDWIFGIYTGAFNPNPVLVAQTGVNMITISSTSPTVITVDQYTSLLGATLEGPLPGNTFKDLGDMQIPSSVSYTLNVATAGAYTLSVLLAGPTNFSIGVSVGSTSQGALSGANTGSWYVFKSITLPVTLPAGQSILTLSASGTPCNIGSITITPGSTPPATDPIISIIVTTTTQSGVVDTVKVL